MKTPQQLLESLFNDAAVKAFPTLPPTLSSLPSVEITQSTQEQFGHYQCNSAMRWSKLLGKPPRQIAEALIQHLSKTDSSNQVVIESLEIAGPGFINIRLTPPYLNASLTTILHSPTLAIPTIAKKQRLIIDFSSPNIAKEMHVGHLRTTIIGDSLARLFEFLGYDVLRLNHLGDWGTSFGMLIAYMKQYTPDVLTGSQPTDLTHLMQWYRASKVEFDNNAAFKTRAQQEVVALQGGDEQALKAWKIICEISQRAFEEIYSLLDIKITNRGESFYNPFLAGVVSDLESKGLITVSEGAKCIFLEGFTGRDNEPLPLIVQKSDGGFNYATTDLTALKHRVEVEKADRIVYVIDSGQSAHLNMVFKAAEKAGYYDPKKTRIDHAAFGLVLGPDGKKFKTRSGDTEKLIDLITTAIDRADEILKERSPEMSQEERKALARSLGIGAIKYADLSTHRISDYSFSYDKMLRFEGNTAAFLMYAYVRIAGIKRKVKRSTEEIMCTGTVDLKHPSEIILGLHLARFGETLLLVADELTPNRLCDYLYQLAEKFNAFFRDCRVEGSPEEASRLLLCETTARTLQQGLELLGLRTVQRM